MNIHHVARNRAAALWDISGKQRQKVPAVVVGLGMTGLGVVRSLSPYGIPLVAVDELPRQGSTYTRFCHKIFVDGSRGEDLWDAVLGLGEAWSPARPVLFLTKDIAVLEASERREEICRFFRFHLPEKKEVKILMDKTAFTEYAESNGLPIPKTYTVQSRQDWDRLIDEGHFPCIVKPKYRSRAWVAARLPKVYRADTPDQLTNLVKILGPVEDSFVAQEWVPGPDSEVFFHLAYYDGDGSPVVSFTGHKIRQWPPLIGSTSMAEGAQSAEVDEEAQRLMRMVGFKGLGSVEFKYDRRDGRFKIMEATVGRPNLQSEVATANGVNIVYHAYCNLTGLVPETRRTPTGNVRWIYFDNDLSSAIQYWRLGELDLRSFLRSYRRPRYYADFSWRDPLPFLVAVLRMIRRAFQRMLLPRRSSIRDDGKQLN